MESLHYSPIDELNTYSNEGYLFHGSPIGDINILEPRTAVDEDINNKFNNDTAVFASDNACSTIIFAVISRKYLPEEIKHYTWSFNWSIDEQGHVITKAKINKSWKPFVENEGRGYVYVLPGEPFVERSGSQWKSKVPVKPVNKIPVSLQDYFDMGGNVEWTE